MRPTRRGVAAILIAVVAFGLGAQFGAPALNALVVPVVVGFVAAAVQVVRAPFPTVDRSEPTPGFPGEQRDLGLRVDATLPCDVRDPVEDGLQVTGVSVGPPDAEIESTPDGAVPELETVRAGAAARTTPRAGRVVGSGTGAAASLPGAATVRVRCLLRSRGVHQAGPALVRMQDSLGLLRRETTVPGSVETLVYPDVVPLADASPLAGLVERATADERAAFDELREYVPGDPLRDVNWKASAKQPEGDLLVTEYAAEDQDGLTVVGEAAPGCTDAMARGVASIASHLLDANLVVEVAVPDGSVDGSRGGETRDRMLELLARTGHGEVDRDGHVRVQADRNGTRVVVGGRTVPFEEIAGGFDREAPVDDSPAGGVADRVREVVA
jgi:uncharacterized protein (DUF58 family)